MHHRTDNGYMRVNDHSAEMISSAQEVLPVPTAHVSFCSIHPGETMSVGLNDIAIIHHECTDKALSVVPANIRRLGRQIILLAEDAKSKQIAQ
jgi:hypothetical protein